MVMQLGFLRDALIEAGASEAKAGKAAVELAGYDNRFGDVSSEMSRFRAEVRTGFASVRSDLALLRWMLGLQLGVILAVALKIFLH